MNLNEKLKIYADVLEDELMSKHTTYRIGGRVKYYIYPRNLISLMRCIRLLKENKIQYEVMDVVPMYYGPIPILMELLSI